MAGVGGKGARKGGYSLPVPSRHEGPTGPGRSHLWREVNTSVGDTGTIHHP